MAENSAIEWTTHTFNPWIGCTKKHTGCTNCYAEADQDIRRGRVKWGPHGTRSRTSTANWKLPSRWNKAAEAAGERHRVFCASLADVFEDWNGPILDHHGNQIPMYEPLDGVSYRTMNMADARRDLFKLIDATPHLDWLLLTKRPENIEQMWPTHCMTDGSGRFRENVWLGTSVSDQETLDEWTPRLLAARDLAPVLFLSIEPLIGAIDFDDCPVPAFAYSAYADCLHKSGRVHVPGIDWVIVGGESGMAARPCRATWVRDIVHQCQDAEVPVFVKQLGSNPEDGHGCHRKLRLNDKKGGDWSEWPEDLRVRAFPEPRVPESVDF